MTLLDLLRLFDPTTRVGTDNIRLLILLFLIALLVLFMIAMHRTTLLPKFDQYCFQIPGILLGITGLVVGTIHVFMILSAQLEEQKRQRQEHQRPGQSLQPAARQLPQARNPDQDLRLLPGGPHCLSASIAPNPTTPPSPANTQSR